MKAAELGNSQAALELGMKMETERNESGCVRYLWMASDSGEMEATIHLAEIYRRGAMVEEDGGESERLHEMVTREIGYQQEVGFMWSIDQREKTLFVKGERIDVGWGCGMPWDNSKSGIKAIVVSDGTETIGERAFRGLSALERVSIPSSVKSIGSTPFLDCNRLQSINVSPSNQLFSSEEGVLFSKDRTLLIACPSPRSGSFIVPNGVVEIGERAFLGCTL